MTPAAAAAPPPLLLDLGEQPYVPTWHAMQAFTQAREGDTADEFWFVHHPPVFTQGLAGKPEHVIDCGDIDLVRTDRGGQVTYHGPGQLVVYPLLDLRRLGLGPRALVSALEQSIVGCLNGYGISAHARREAPGVYVGERKIASIGLRIRRGCSYHGLALNVAMDLAPFSRINPCGYRGLEMTQLSDLGVTAQLGDVTLCLIPHLLAAFGWSLTDGLMPRDGRQRLHTLEAGE